MQIQIIHIIGDVHADWQNINGYINTKIRQSKKIRELAKEHELEVIFLQCGDFGIWTKEDIENLPIKNKVDFLKDGYAKIYFADGNHENHDILDELEKNTPHTSFIEISKEVYFATFGSVFTLIDGTKILFVGGAESMDKEHRTLGVSWWEQEGIDHQDMAKLPETHIDWIISHAAPTLFKELQMTPLKKDELSRQYLDSIFLRYKPSKWFFGHYHISQKGNILTCDWRCLNMSDRKNGWLETFTIQK